MRILLPVFAAALVMATASSASACLEIVSARSEAKAFRQAYLVVSVEGVSEDYAAVFNMRSLRLGVGTGRVIEVFKGHARKGQLITYRLRDGEDGMGCPGRRFARPGKTYKLYLRYPADHGPLEIILPSDWNAAP
jgi:hypothetical protein